MSMGDFQDTSLLELFRIETENQAQVLTTGLLALEQSPTAADQLEACMRAAHSLKGAARIVDRAAAVTVAHAMEDCFVAAQEGRLTLTQADIDLLFVGVDLLQQIARASDDEAAQWQGARRSEIETFVAAVKAGGAAMSAVAQRPRPRPTPVNAAPATTDDASSAERVVRVTAENLNRLLDLAGESLVAARWVKPFSESLQRLKRTHRELGQSLGSLRDALAVATPNGEAQLAHLEAQHRLEACATQLAQRLEELEAFDRRSLHLSHRLYDEALAVRMRPFGDAVRALPRLVRDLGRSLEKEVRLEVLGEATPADRDILNKLEAPLNHLLRNAVDHGIETPAERVAAGKPAEGVIQLEARHRAGRLHITVVDDGRGIDLDRLREVIVARGLSTGETVMRMSESELLEFLFLPGFSLRGSVTEISGRGVGLDVVRNVVKELRGTVHVSSQPGRGLRFQFLLPLTLSVLRTLLVEIGGEPYAFPLAAIARTLKLPPADIALLEGRQHFDLHGRRTSLIAAAQVLGVTAPPPTLAELPVVVVGDAARAYGLVVDRFLGESELVVHALDPRLGKIKDIAAAALMEDGAPVLIFDVEDLLHSIEKLIATGGLGRVPATAAATEGRRSKRVLVVDDSLTVRELERKLLSSRGYAVEVAVDGLDGWNAVRTGRFDLVVTDVDMPRMDGVELVELIKRDPRVKSVPVMIVSYKDREEDRQRGLNAGADYYLAKGSFHDETLLHAVVDLIGEATA